jgi:hypothetical protein
MKKMKLYGALAVMLLTGVAACDRSDGMSDADSASFDEALMPQGMDPATMQLVMEIQTIQQQLEPTQQAALQDEALASQLEVLQARVDAAMREENAEAVDRMERLRAELDEVAASGDQERMQMLMMEGQVLQQEMQVIQAAVFERPDIRGPIEEFEAAHRARMIQIDPEAGALIDRMEELIAQLPN